MLIFILIEKNILQNVGLEAAISKKVSNNSMEVK